MAEMNRRLPSRIESPLEVDMGVVVLNEKIVHLLDFLANYPEFVEYVHKMILLLTLEDPSSIDLVESLNYDAAPLKKTTRDSKHPSHPDRKTRDFEMMVEDLMRKEQKGLDTQLKTISLLSQARKLWMTDEVFFLRVLSHSTGFVSYDKIAFILQSSKELNISLGPVEEVTKVIQNRDNMSEAWIPEAVRALGVTVPNLDQHIASIRQGMKLQNTDRRENR